MKLQQLFQDLLPIEYHGEQEITGLSLNTQHLKPGELFIALKSGSQQGNAYIQEALAKGAAAVLCDEYRTLDISKPIFTLPHLNEKLTLLVNRFYGEAKDIPVTGVTGTNGKTTITFLLSQSLSQLGANCAVIGTLGYGFVQHLHTSGYTTPDIISLQKYITTLKKQGAKAIAMEVSSHGLDQGRTQNVPFESAIFTNLTQDHLDYHGNMDDYGRAKQKLFKVPSLKRAIINADSPYAEKMIRCVHPDVAVVLCSNEARVRENLLKAHPHISTITVTHAQLDQKGITATVHTPQGEGQLRSPLLGAFNLNNLLLVLGELIQRGFGLAESLAALSHAHPAPGRMQRLGGIHTAQVIIDYAHTPDALENALHAARGHCRRRLWCVFGCGGERDKDKRGKMGRIAAELADKVILTNDNPRSEDPNQILQEIWLGAAADNHEKMSVIEDRKSAIEYAMTHALPVDTILIAGKGHEDYQIIGNQKYPFSDEECVKALLGEKSE